MLEAETRYLPLHSELGLSPLKPFNLGVNNRPLTAPPEGRQQVTFAEINAAKQEEKRPKTANREEHNNNHNEQYNPTNHHHQSQQNMCNIQQTGYDRLDLKQQHGNSRHSQAQNKRLAANFVPPKATISESRPQSHMKKRSVSPVTKAQEFQTEDSDVDGIADDTQSSLELKLLKALIANRKNKKSTRRSVQDGAVVYSQDVGSSPYRYVLLCNSIVGFDGKCIFFNNYSTVVNPRRKKKFF